MQLSNYEKKLNLFLNSINIFYDLYKLDILNKEEFLQIQENLRNKYTIKGNSIYLFNPLDI